MTRRIQTERGPDVDAVVARALGFDVARELDLCRRLAAGGGATRVQEVFDRPRAARLLQGLLATGRHRELDELWKASVAAGVDRGTLAPPEWN
jgi:hypothetical protein